MNSVYGFVWIRRALVSVVVLIAAVWLAAGALFCEQALRVPRHTPTLPQPAEAREMRIVQIVASDGVVLRGTFLRGRENSECVLLLHGIADSHASAAGFAGMFLKAGYSVLAPDSRGHGTSGGEIVTFGVLESADVIGWASWMREQGCRRLFGLGESLGGAILIQAAAVQPVFSAVAAECAFQDLPKIAEYRVGQMMRGPAMVRQTSAKALVAAGLLYARVRFGLDLRRASPVASVTRLETPLLLIHGEDDTNTPASHSQALAAASLRAELWLVPGAAHTNASAVRHEEFQSRVLEWFDRHRAERR